MHRVQFRLEDPENNRLRIVNGTRRVGEVYSRRKEEAVIIDSEEDTRGLS